MAGTVKYELRVDNNTEFAVSKNEKTDKFEIGLRSPDGNWTLVVTMSGIQFVGLLDRMDRVHMSECDAVITAYEEVN